MQTRQLIGVIDLMNGKAVRAVGGQRNTYQPVHSFVHRDGRRVDLDGIPLRLVGEYSAADILSLYVADLDGIRWGRPRFHLIREIIDSAPPLDQLLLDLGIKGSESGQQLKQISSLSEQHPSVVIVIATESARAVEALEMLRDQVPHDRIAVSFDYHAGRWISDSTTESEWITACRERNVATVIGLDLAAVGSDSIRRTAQLCRSLRPRLSCADYVTGGGINTNQDLQTLEEAGADRFMVASMFCR